MLFYRVKFGSPGRSIKDNKFAGNILGNKCGKQIHFRNSCLFSVIKRAGNKGLAPRDGFEPPTKRLTISCSTAELPGTNTLARMLYSNDSTMIQFIFTMKTSTLSIKYGFRLTNSQLVIFMDKV